MLATMSRLGPLGGLRVCSEADPVVSHNCLRHNHGEGVLVCDNGLGRFAHNSVHSNQGHGIMVAAEARPEVAHCRLQDNGKALRSEAAPVGSASAPVARRPPRA